MYAFSPKQIEARLYKTPLQRLRDFYEDNERKIAWVVISLLLLTLSLTYMHKVDKKYFYPVAAKYEILNQSKGSIGTGAMILNANYKPQ